MHNPPSFLPPIRSRAGGWRRSDDPVLAVWTADQAARVELLGLGLIGLLFVLLGLHAWSLVDRARRRWVERDLYARLAALEAARVRRAAAAPEDERKPVRPRYERWRLALYPEQATPS